MKKEKAFEIIRPALIKYIGEEFERITDGSDLMDETGRIGIAYTTYGNNEEYDIQVDINMEEMKMYFYINDVCVYEEDVDERDLVNASEWLDFDNLISIAVDYLPDEYWES